MFTVGRRRLCFAESVAKNWLERNQPKSSCHAKSLHAVIHLQLVVNIRQVEVYRSLRYHELLGCFLTAVTLRDQTKNFHLRRS